MDETPIIELIDPELEELMERFFNSSKADLADMQSALDLGDYDTLTRLGHTAKGTGYGYGFRGMGQIGQELEQAAKAGDKTGSQALVNRMGYYLANVKVEFGS